MGRVALSWFALSCLVWGRVYAAPEGGPPPTPKPIDESSAQPNAPEMPGNEKEKRSGTSWVPIVGYNPTYKLFFGGGFFHYRPNYSLGVHGVVTFEQVFQIMTKWQQRIDGPLSYGLDYEFSKGYEPYYGEGGETRVADKIRLFGHKTLGRAKAIFEVNPFVNLGFFVDYRIRVEDHVEDGPNVRRFPNETSVGLGIFHEIDKRDNRDDSTAGFVLESAFLHVPAAFTTVPGMSGFYQLEGNFAIYQEMVGEVIAAVKLGAGVTFGTPTYLYKFRLGGTDSLRGYLDNRLRGKKYYCQQTELRFPIWDFLEGVPFIGFGDATDDNFTQAKMAYGIGVRIGLPPDYVSKIRIDYGIGRDESGVFVDFGQTF